MRFSIFVFWAFAFVQTIFPMINQSSTQPERISNNQRPIASTQQKSPADIQSTKNDSQTSSTNAPYAIPPGSRFYFYN